MNVVHAQTCFVDHRWSYAERRNVSVPDDERMPEHVFGTSSAWRDVLKRATRVAATEATALLQGESGTGKEVVARFIRKYGLDTADPA